MRAVVNALVLVLLLFVIAVAILSGWEITGQVLLRPWRTGVTISLLLTDLLLAEVLTASFLLGVLVAMTAVSVFVGLPRSAVWMALLCAYLIALLVLVGMRGDIALARTLATAALGILAGGALWQAVPFLSLPPLHEAQLRVGSMCLLGVLVASALLGETLVLRTILALAFGAGALWIGYHAFLSLRNGGVIETENRFAGLGGGLGGWRLSLPTSLLLLTMILAGAAVLLGRPDAKPEPATVAKLGQEPGAGTTKTVEKKTEKPATDAGGGKGAAAGSVKPVDNKDGKLAGGESETGSAAPTPAMPSEKKDEKPAGEGGTGAAAPAPAKPND